MEPPTRRARRTRHAGPALGIALAATLVLGIAWTGRFLAARDPLRRSRAAAEATGAYAVVGTTRASADAGIAEYRVGGTGMVDGPLTLTIRSAASDAATATYRIAWPDVRLNGSDGEAGDAPIPAPNPHALALVLPVGDPLALLATGHAAEVGGLEAVDGLPCRRVDFLVGAQRYLAWRKAHPGNLPANADSGGLDKLRGGGTLWVDPATDLPCRIAARLELQRLGGEQPGVGEVDWVYDDWGAAGETR